MDRILETFPSRYRGPGGAVAIVRDGSVVSRRVWGYADLERRIPMTPHTLIPICSISKQMLCLALLHLSHHPTPTMSKRSGDLWEQMTAELPNVLPNLVGDGDFQNLKINNLFDMQSGIRDYWALTVLWGARAEDPFSIADAAPKALERLRSFHFTPGTSYSYSNVNFRVLGRILETVSGQSMGQLLSERVFIPAGMTTAALNPNTFGHPLPIVGYEGDEEHGFFPAINRIEWSGDAGIVASLEDMIAYEKFLHRSWEDPNSLYHALAEPPKYTNGAEAPYGHGLMRGKLEGRTTLGHSGGLRGFRLGRVHVPDEKLSMITLFNSEFNRGNVIDATLREALGIAKPQESTEKAAKEWVGDFLDPETQLMINVKAAKDGEVSLRYTMAAETLKLVNAHEAESRSMTAKIEGDTLHVSRPEENRTFSAKRIDKSKPKAPTVESTGSYYCSDTDSTFHCSGDAEMLYGYFEGFLGTGPAHLMKFVGEDSWMLSCPRSMDAPAPGDWTVNFHRDGNGEVNGATIGCWLARGLGYVKGKTASIRGR